MLMARLLRSNPNWVTTYDMRPEVLPGMNLEEMGSQSLESLASRVSAKLFQGSLECGGFRVHRDIYIYIYLSFFVYLLCIYEYMGLWGEQDIRPDGDRLEGCVTLRLRV